MKSGLFILMLCLSYVSLSSQSNANDSLPDGIYKTLDDFNNHSPDTSIKIRRLNLGVPSSKAFLDSIVDHVLFLDKLNAPIAKVFAIVHKGEIYFQEKAIRQNVMEGYGGKNSASKNRFHRIQERGRYFYGETYFASADPAEIAAMSFMFGVIGGVATAATSKGTIFEVPYVFDTKLNKFFVLGSRNNLQLFMDTYHPEIGFQVAKGKLDYELVRAHIIQFNINGS
ncbi:MAG TPA: hypothetical protein VFG10_07095 [Saprospiraceae bacterium]|nr:hypothetical protein [Saprospiraceae bacterium]